MKEWLSRIRKEEAGLVLPAVLAMLSLGSLLIIPSLNYVATSLKTGEMVEENVEGLYAADAGIEDALWRIKNDKPASFPYSYQLSDVNGMSVDVVIDQPATIFGEETFPQEGHSDWLVITKSISYDAGIYFYTLSITNNGEGNIKVEKILIDFPPYLEYVAGSTGGDITTVSPTVIGHSTTGIALVWDISVPQPTVEEGATKDHAFQLNGPPDISGIEGHGFVQATRQDIGTVWDGDSHPYTITAQAKDATSTVVATIRVGVWEAQLYITCWEVSR